MPSTSSTSTTVYNDNGTVTITSLPNIGTSFVGEYTGTGHEVKEKTSTDGPTVPKYAIPDTTTAFSGLYTDLYKRPSTTSDNEVDMS